ncbi:MAG: energy transducer TonB, partial [Burkholderiales bacterium]
MISTGHNRVFHYAVLASLVLHALLLFGFPDLIDTARRAVSFPPPIIARLLQPEPAPAKPQPAKETAKPAPPAAKPAPELPVAAAPDIRAEKPAPRIEAPAPPAPAASPPVAVIEPRTAAPSPPPAEAPESLSRDQYRLQLIDEARRHKRYPPLARENNWQGEVPVRVLVGANGRASVTLRGSSGYEVLDRQALEMFGQAARAVPVPQALRGREFALDLRAVYGLE